MYGRYCTALVERGRVYIKNKNICLSLLSPIFERRMLLAVQIWVVFLLVPWLVKVLYPIRTRIKKEEVRSLHLLFLLLWLYRPLRYTVLGCLDYIPFYTVLESLFFLYLSVRSTKFLKDLQVWLLPTKQTVHTVWNKCKTLYWEPTIP
jgi:hypothetical protein